MPPAACGILDFINIVLTGCLLLFISFLVWSRLFSFGGGVLSLLSLLLSLLFNLEKQGAVDVGEDTTKGDGGTNERVEFLVAANRELQMAGSDALDLEILGGILREKNMSECMTRR